MWQLFVSIPAWGPGPVGCPNSAQGSWAWGKGLSIHSKPQGPKAERDREPSDGGGDSGLCLLGQCDLRKKASKRLSGQERTWRRLSCSWLPRVQLEGRGACLGPTSYPGTWVWWGGFSQTRRALSPSTGRVLKKPSAALGQGPAAGALGRRKWQGQLGPGRFLPDRPAHGDAAAAQMEPSLHPVPRPRPAAASGERGLGSEQCLTSRPPAGCPPVLPAPRAPRQPLSASSEYPNCFL